MAKKNRQKSKKFFVTIMNGSGNEATVFVSARGRGSAEGKAIVQGGPDFRVVCCDTAEVHHQKNKNPRKKSLTVSEGIPRPGFICGGLTCP